jgi:hypothetical protein
MSSLKPTAAALALAFVLGSGPALARQELTLGSASAMRGQSVAISLGYAGDGSAAGLQLDVTFDPAVLGAPSVAAGTGIGGQVLRSAVISSGRLRLVIYSPVNAAMGDGELARLSFTVSNTAPLGSSTLGISGVVLGNANAAAIAPSLLTNGSVLVLAGVPPKVLSFGTVGDTGDNVVVEKETTQVSVTQILVRFSAPVSDPAGNTQPGDVTNPTSYRLVSAGADGVIDTVSCAVVAPGDVAVPVDSVSYDSASTTAALFVGGGFALPKGLYRVLVCPTITSPAGDALDGNGDGSPGDEALRTFEVGRTNLLRNPNFDRDLVSWILVSRTPQEILRVMVDSDGALTSGSAQVMNLTGAGEIYSLAQCVTLTGKGAYGAGGRARINSGRTTAPSFYAAIEYHAGAGCTGAILATNLTPAVRGDSAGIWKPLTGVVQSPDTAVSALVMFVLDSGASPDFTALLDAPSFERVEVFRDGFESGNLSRWSGGGN